MKLTSSTLVRGKIACLCLVFTLFPLLTFMPPAHAQQFEVKLASLTSPVFHGNDATIAVTTAANANCQIIVLYKSGPSKAQGLIPKSADAQGQVSWTWKVGSRTTPGGWPITVTCSSGSQSGTLKTLFVVR